MQPTKTAPAKPGACHHPLGPWVYRLASANPGRDRAAAALVFAGALGLLAVAAWLTPNVSGLGTHRQLGFPTCTMIVLTGYPCPTCGMTTAFSFTVRGRFWAAFSAHPGGLFLALSTVAALSVSLSVLVTGRVWRVNWYRVTPFRLSITVVTVVLGGWAYKVIVGLISGTLPIGG